MNRMRRILSFIQAVALMLSIMPINMTMRASATVIEDDTQTPSQPTTILADDARIHRSSGGTNAPKMEDGEYQIGRAVGNLIYDRNNRSEKPCLYNFAEMMTNPIGNSTDKAINRYPYVVIKVNAPEAGYYDLGVTLNANPSSLVNSAAILVDGFMHIVNLTKPYNTKQTLTVEDVYLTQGEHTIMYTSALPENENEVVSSDLCYPWTNLWSFTFGAGLEVLDASSLTGADVENIMKQPTRIEAEDTRFASWNIYSKTEANGSASGDTVVGGPAYAQCQQTFADLTANGLDHAKTPYLQYAVEAPVAGTYYVTIGAYVGTSTNNSNPVPYVAVIANDNAPVKAQFDGVWNQFDSVTVAVQLQKGVNLIRCTSVTPDQYSTGTAWVNQDYLEVQGTLTAMRTGVYAADSDNADYLYLSRYTDQDTKFGEPGNYADLRWDYPSLYETMTGIYTKKDDGNTRWPYIAFKVNAPKDGEYRISAKIGASADAKNVGMIVDGATYVVDVTTASGWMRGTAYLSAGEHVIIFTSPIPRDMKIAAEKNNALYPWMDYYAFELDGGLTFLETPDFEQIQTSMQNYSRVEAENYQYATTNGKYSEETTKTYTRRAGECVVTVKGTAGTYSDSDYVEYKVSAATAGTYVIRIGAYLEGEGTLPYGTIVVNGQTYKAQFAGNWNGYDVVNLAVELNAGENTIRLFGANAETNGWIGYDFMDLPEGVKPEGERKSIKATDSDCADYLYLNRYTDAGSNFGGPNYEDMRWDYPSLYEPMTGIYTQAADGTMRWPYIALRVDAEEAGFYQIAATIQRNTAVSLGMIVDGSTYVMDVTSNDVSKTVYLTKGEHIVIFTAPIPRDMIGAPKNDKALYPWMNYVSFKVSDGLNFLEAPTFDQIQASMQTYSRVEAEDISYATASGKYAEETTKTYTRIYGAYDVTVKGMAGTYSDSDYVEYKVSAVTAGTYVLRIGAYLEGEGTLPYGTVVINGTEYQVKFSGNWNGYDVVNLAVALQAGENTVRLYGASAETNGWIGYDFMDLPAGVKAEGERKSIKATDDDCADYLYLNRYEDMGDKFADPGPGNSARPDLHWDYPSLYESMTGIYTKTNDGTKARWPYVALRVNAFEAGEYRISVKIATSADAKTIGMIVDGTTYVVDGVVASGWLRETVYLSEGEHVIVITTPMPRDMELGAEQNTALYPWMDYYAFEVDHGLSFLEAPTFDQIQTSMQTYSRVEAEDISYATATGKYANEITKTYTRRNGAYMVTVKGTAGTYSDSDYVEYKVSAATAGTYVIRIGAYLEGEGALPCGRIMVNGTEYQVKFAGNWNGYDVVNLAVDLQEGENTVRLYGASAETTGWIGYDFLELPNGVQAEGQRRLVSAADEDCADYLYLNRYADEGSNFGGPNYEDMRWDYPSLYEPMTGIYTQAADGTMRWPYIAFRVNAEEAGYYKLSATIERNTAVTLGMIVDGATYVVDVTSNGVSKSVYLTQGEHIVIFTAPMPRDMIGAPKNDKALYPWMNYISFKLDTGLRFGSKPTTADIQASMQNYSRVEAEEFSYVTVAGKYAEETTKTYTRRNGAYAVTVKGTADTYSNSDYVEYTVSAAAAGTYVIRIGAYLEGEGALPYGTILVNGTVYKAQFTGDWNGYDVVNLPVVLQEGTNVIRCLGVSAEQTNGWIGYDFLELPEGIKLQGDRKIVSATDDDCADYLYLNEYKDTGSVFGGPNYDHMRWDYPSLYGDMLGIYSDAKPDREGYWPYIALRVHAQKAGNYRLAVTVERNTAKTVGMIVDGATYVLDVTSNEIVKSVYLTKGDHIVIFTAPIPRDMELVPGQDAALYPWMNYVSFKVDADLSFSSKPTAEAIRASMQNYSRVEAEDILYAVTYHADYSDYTTKKYASRYDSEMTAVMGASGAVIDGKVSSAELKANTSQTFEQLSKGLDAATSYVEYAVSASKAGTYVIRVGAYIEGGGTMPYGTILVNGTAYKAQFTGNWNGYDVVNIPVELQEGKNTIRCVGVTADQTNSNGWIGYDHLDVPGGVSAVKAGTTLVHAGNENYVTFNNYKDQGDTLGGAHYLDLRWDRLSIDVLNYAYLARIPYAAVQVTAEKDGTYDIYFKSKFKLESETQQIGVLVDGVTAYSMPVSEFRSFVSVPLTKGTHTLVFTTPMPETESVAAESEKFDAEIYSWMDMESFVIGAGLKVENAPNQESVENPYVTLEAESYAMPNLVKVNETGVGSGVYLKAQTAAQILKDGLDSKVTPFVEYHIDASEAGTYDLYVALKSGTSATMTARRMQCSFVIENGGDRQVKSVYSHKDTQGVVRVIPVTLKLNKGANVVRITHFTGDSVVDKGYYWNDFDYIQVSPATAKKLTFRPTLLLEAEQGSYTSYVEKIGTGYSGDTYLGDATYGYIDENQITFETLDVENLGDLPRVTYLFEAEKAGTYTLSVKFNTGLINYKPEELEKIGFAMIVNGKSKQLVEFSLATLQASTTRLFTVDLVEGENEITFTSTLADYMRAVKPRIEDQYRLVWVDHDALYLSYGLSTGREAERFGIEDSSVDHEQLKLMGLTDDTNHGYSTTTKDETSGLMTYMIIGVTAGAVLVGGILILAKKKKAGKNN